MTLINFIRGLLGRKKNLKEKIVATPEPKTQEKKETKKTSLKIVKPGYKRDLSGILRDSKNQDPINYLRLAAGHYNGIKKPGFIVRQRNKNLKIEYLDTYEKIFREFKRMSVYGTDDMFNTKQKKDNWKKSISLLEKQLENYKAEFRNQHQNQNIEKMQKRKIEFQDIIRLTKLRYNYSIKPQNQKFYNYAGERGIKLVDYLKPREMQLRIGPREEILAAG